MEVGPQEIVESGDCHTIPEEEAALKAYLRLPKPIDYYATHPNALHDELSSNNSAQILIRLILAEEHLRAGRCFVDDPPKL